MASSYVLQSSEVGKVINLTQPSGGITFAGASCHLLVTNPSGIQLSYLCTIDPTNKFAQYTTLGSEFPTAGSYQVQLEYQNSGEKYFSPVASLKVLANLT